MMIEIMTVYDLKCSSFRAVGRFHSLHVQYYVNKDTRLAQKTASTPESRRPNEIEKTVLHNTVILMLSAE